jgi:hypothetical protein
MKKFLLLIAAILLCSMPLSLSAQDSSSMTGVVTDASGAVIPGTVVLLTNPARGISFTVKSDSDGSYRFPNVPPAPGYKVKFSHDGFSDATIDGVSLVVGSTRTQNAKLVAGSQQQLEVTATNSVITLNTTDASIGNNFDIQLVNDLPVQNRNTPAALFILQPGVTASGNVTGARTDQTSFTVDGMDVNDISTGSFTTIVGNIPVDATQEFRGTVAGLPSSLGTGSGGQFQLVTKSGTNRFHGNINEYHRDTSTVSNTWFNNNTIPVTPTAKFIRNQFGGAIGGPIWKDKLFFFADFYDSRILQALTVARTVPLDSYRAGNLSYINNNAGCTSTSRQNTTPGCITQLTPAQIAAFDPAHIGFSPTILSLIASRYPHANDLTGGDGVNTGSFRFTQGTATIEYDGVARVDYNLTKKQRIFLQYHNSHIDGIQSINRFANDPITRPNQNRSYGYVGSHLWEISNNKVNQFYYGDNVQVVSFPLTFNPNGTTYVNGFGPFTAPYDGGNIQRRRIPIPTVRDDFNWQLGKHNLGIGGSFKFIKTSNLLVNDYNFYTLGLGGATTALNSSLRPANILNSTTPVSAYDSAFTLGLGRVAAITSNYNYTNAGTVLPNASGNVRRYRYFQTEAYVGDTWKLNKELTVTYGVRYQYYSVPFDTKGGEAIPNVGFNTYFASRIAQSAAGASGNASLPFLSYNLGGSANNAPGFFQPNVHDFAPRVAFAYNPSYSPKTVINGGASVVYDRTVYNAINFIQNQSSFLFQNQAVINYGQTSANAALLADPRVGATLTTLPAPPVAPALSKPYTPYVTSAGVPTGLAGGNSNIAVDPNFKTPYSVSFNMGVQQEFPGRFIMKLNYVGRLGRRLLANADASQLIDFTDPKSGQALSTAFAALETQLRNGTAPLSVTAQPFFENLITPGFGVAHGYPNNTAVLAYNQTTNVKLGDITDPIRFLASNNLLPANVGVASQFAENDYYTNKGFSSYNGLLFTLSKNMSQGFKFDFNYTLSHSVDNVSVIANTVASGTGFICDVIHPRACRGNSDFDVTHIITSDILYELPVGRGKMFAANAPWYVQEAIGGWSLSAIPTWQSGIAYTVFTGAYLAGFANNDPAIYDGSNSSDTATHYHKNSANQLQAFVDPTKAASHFSAPTGIQYGTRNPLRGPSQLYFDAGLAKTFVILPNDRLNLKFRADGFNILNHPTFATPASTLANLSTFGVITANTNPIGGYPYRTGQFSLRLEF